MCRLSLIVPVYNIQEYIGDCLSSIVPQLSEKVELIVVDDGSTDNSAEVIKRFLSNPFIKCIYQENKGSSGARNTGLKAAKGKYIWFIDGDDMIESNSIEIIFKYADTHLKNHDIMMFYTSHVKQDGSDKKVYIKMKDLSNESTKSFLKKQKIYSVSPCFELISLDFLNDNQILFNEGMVFEDENFLLRVYNKAMNISSIPHALYSYRNRPNSNSRSMFTLFKLNSIFKNIILCNELKPEQLSRVFINQKLFWYIHSYLKKCFLFEKEIREPAIKKCFDLVPKIPISLSDSLGVIRLKLIYNYNKKLFLRKMQKD